MTFTELAEYVEGMFNPRRYTSVGVDRTRHKGCLPTMTFRIHVGSTEHDRSDAVEGESIDEVRHLFDERWVRDPIISTVAEESEKVDVQ